MTDEQFRAELSELEARLSRLERWAGLAPLPAPKQPEPESPPTDATAASPIAAAIAPPTLSVPPIAAASPVPTLPVAKSPVPQAVPQMLPPIVPPGDANLHELPPRPRRTGPSLEVLIGERWMAWVGSIVVVLAVGFFVKLAYDMGWWGRLPALAKCVVCATFGAALVGAGEVALRRVGRMAAVSLFGAGLGTLYLTAYATFRFFELLSQSGAFWLMLLVAALGFAITLRGSLVVIGVLSLIGGYLSPILLSEQVTFAAALPLYLTALLVVALALSVKAEKPFRTLRYVGIALHMAVASLWLLREGTDHWLLSMTFLTTWWTLVTGEALLAALRGQSAIGNAVLSLLFTFWYVALGCDVLVVAQPGQRNTLGLFTGLLAAICAWIALPLGAGLTVLKNRPRRPAELFAATQWAQVGILLAAAIGLQFREPGQSFGQSIGWIVMGVACVELGRRLPSRAVDVFGLFVAALGITHVWSNDWMLSRLQTVAWSDGDVTVRYWSLLALGAIAATFFIGQRLRTGESRQWMRFAGVLIFLGALQWMALSVACCQHLALTAAWLLAVAGLLLAARLGTAYRRSAAFVLLLTALKWLAIDAVVTRAGSGWSPLATLPLLNWQMAVAVAICLGIYWLFRTPGPTPVISLAGERVAVPESARPAPTANLLAAAVLFLLLALSFEVEHAIARVEALRPADTSALWNPHQTRALWLTLLWAVGGLVSFAIGRLRRQHALFATGGVLLTVSACVWLTYDTLYFRSELGVVLCPVVFNLQFLIGATLIVLVAVAARLARSTRPGALLTTVEINDAGIVGLALAAALGLWLGSLELDRYFAPEAARVTNPAMARQTALSVYWGLYAMGLVTLGFWKRAPGIRYAGLGLLALTLVKVLLIDLAKVQYVYRVLSLLAVGLLFIGTSIAYARLTSRLERHAPPAAPPPPRSSA